MCGYGVLRGILTVNFSALAAGGPTGAAERGPREVQAHRPGSRDSKSPGQNGLESVDRENFGHLPLDPALFYPVQTLGLSAPHGAAATSRPQPVHVGRAAYAMSRGSGRAHDGEGWPDVHQRRL